MKLANVEAEENFKIKTLKVFKIQVKNDNLTREELKYLKILHQFGAAN